MTKRFTVFMGFFLNAIFFLSFAFSSEASVSQQTTFKVIVINTATNDQRGHGNLDKDEQTLMDDYRSLFPEDEIIAIRPTTNFEIREMLYKVTRGNVKVRAVYVNSHGKSEWLEVTDHNNQKTNLFVPKIWTEDKKINLNLRDKFTKFFFKPLEGKWAHDAQVIFESCNLLRDLSREMTFKVMRDVAKNLTLDRGTLYLNRNYGSRMMESIFKQDLDELHYYSRAKDEIPGKGRKNFPKLIMYTFPVGVPLGYLMENIQANSGYLLVQEDSHEIMIKTRYGRVRGYPTQMIDDLRFRSGMVEYKFFNGVLKKRRKKSAALRSKIKGSNWWAWKVVTRTSDLERFSKKFPNNFVQISQ